MRRYWRTWLRLGIVAAVLTVMVPVLAIGLHYPYGQPTTVVWLTLKSSGRPLNVTCHGFERLSFRMLHITRDDGPGFDLKSVLAETNFIALEDGTYTKWMTDESYVTDRDAWMLSGGFPWLWLTVTCEPAVLAQRVNWTPRTFQTQAMKVSDVQVQAAPLFASFSSWWLSFVTVVTFYDITKRWSRRRRGCCERCGYGLGAPALARCPECGVSVGESEQDSISPSR